MALATRPFGVSPNCEASHPNEMCIRDSYYGDDVYIRGLIEFTNCCRNDCYYCGIRRSNTRASRYRLTEEEILACCREGWAIGYRTFVLQGGEDPAWGPDRIAALVASIKQARCV